MRSASDADGNIRASRYDSFVSTEYEKSFRERGDRGYVAAYRET